MQPGVVRGVAGAELSLVAHLHDGGHGAVIRTATLDNGIRFVTETMPDVASLTVGVWVGTGSRDETPEQAGISHFLEHLLFKGTPNGARARSPRRSTPSAAT